MSNRSPILACNSKTISNFENLFNICSEESFRHELSWISLFYVFKRSLYKHVCADFSTVNLFFELWVPLGGLLFNLKICNPNMIGAHAVCPHSLNLSFLSLIVCPRETSAYGRKFGTLHISYMHTKFHCRQTIWQNYTKF